MPGLRLDDDQAALARRSFERAGCSDDLLAEVARCRDLGQLSAFAHRAFGPRFAYNLIASVRNPDAPGWMHFELDGTVFVFGNAIASGTLAARAIIGDQLRSEFPVFCSGPLLVRAVHAPMIEVEGTLWAANISVRVGRAAAMRIGTGRVDHLQCKSLAAGSLHARRVVANSAVVNELDCALGRFTNLETRLHLSSEIVQADHFSAWPGASIRVQRGRLGVLRAPITP